MNDLKNKFYKVSIVIPIKDDSDPYLEECLTSLKKIEYSNEVEILVIKGGNISQARNHGTYLATGNLIAFIDSDCIAPANWLKDLVKWLHLYPNIGGVGGPNISPSSDSSLGKMLDLTFSTTIGSLRSPSLFFPSKPIFVNKLACINSIFWKENLIEVAGFDERFFLCEDTNISYKVREKNLKLLFVPEPFVYHHRRKSIWDFSKQFFNYGIGRMRSMLTDTKYVDTEILCLFMLVLFTPLLSLIFPIVFYLLISLYIFIIFFEGIRLSISNKQILLFILIPLLLLIEHVSYFVGLLYGVLKGKWSYVPPDNSELYLRFNF